MAKPKWASDEPEWRGNEKEGREASAEYRARSQEVRSGRRKMTEWEGGGRETGQGKSREGRRRGEE